ncbi:hypothetical protein [Mesorhizobium qingshengii]|uniref:hypothetical protein n=1 Tax=Mesorhizobium qingshengii TaxID=1165689 RepID=UPI001428A83E|nr:hypothetical protein [Mesorhizobium qingshengii]
MWQHEVQIELGHQRQGEASHATGAQCAAEADAIRFKPILPTTLLTVLVISAIYRLLRT